MLRSFSAIFNNLILWVGILAYAIAQLLKFLIEIIKYKKIDLTLFFSSGGMPSSHSALVCSMSTGVGFIHGFDSGLFAVSVIISMVVMYDAAGVRRAAGRHAAAINTIYKKIENQGIVIDQKLKELLGHSPVEVAAGAVLGVLTGILIIGMRVE